MSHQRQQGHHRTRQLQKPHLHSSHNQLVEHHKIQRQHQLEQHIQQQPPPVFLVCETGTCCVVSLLSVDDGCVHRDHEQVCHVHGHFVRHGGSHQLRRGRAIQRE